MTSPNAKSQEAKESDNEKHKNNITSNSNNNNTKNKNNISNNNDDNNKEKINDNNIKSFIRNNNSSKISREMKSKNRLSQLTLSSHSYPLTQSRTKEPTSPTKNPSSSRIRRSLVGDVRHNEALQRIDGRKDLIKSLDTDIKQVECLLKKLKVPTRIESTSSTSDEESIKSHSRNPSTS